MSNLCKKPIFPYASAPNAALFCFMYETASNAAFFAVLACARDEADYLRGIEWPCEYGWVVL